MKREASDEKRLKAIDLCCGAGGWAVAARGLPIDIVCAVDKWDLVCETYRLNFPDTNVVQADLVEDFDRIIKLLTAENPDLILGGIPCEWISVLRRIELEKTDLEHYRQLLRHCLEIVRILAPRFWCLEDVIQIIKEAERFWPNIPHQVLDSGFWSQQRRKRAYLGEFPTPPAGEYATRQDYLRRGPYRIGRTLQRREPSLSKAMYRDFFTPVCSDRIYPTVCKVRSRHDGDVGVFDEQVPGGARQVEWQEAAAAQGWPEDFLFVGSPTAVATMVGQSIQIDTGRAILEAICEEWEREA